MPFEFLSQALLEREQQGLLRREQVVETYQQQYVTIAARRYINFSSNDYLGLAQTPFNTSTQAGGSGGSPVVTGYSKQHQELCEYLAAQLNREAVLLVNSGFAANATLCQSLFSKSGSQSPVKGNLVVDKLAHASIIDGALASHANFSRFRHNDMDHLHSLLAKNNNEGDTLIMSEGVFSMDGDQAPISELVRISQQHSAWLSLDDAHGFGVLGQNGMGTVEANALSQSELPVLMATFGKAIGTGGAFIAGSQTLIDYLRNFARHYVYSTAFSPMQAAHTLANIKLCQQENWRREKLQNNIRLFKRLMQDAQLEVLSSDTAIQPVLIGCPKLALKVADELRQSGFWVTAIRTPTVPKNTDRIRITLTTLHEEQDIQHLVSAFAEVMERNKEERSQS